MMVWLKQVKLEAYGALQISAIWMDVLAAAASGLKCPDVVVVDDDMEVEVWMNEGPSGVRNRVSLEASRRT